MKMKEKTKKQTIIFWQLPICCHLFLEFLWALDIVKGPASPYFPNAQMYYPAAGVMLAALITRKGDALLPRRFFIGFILLTAALVVAAIGSVLSSSTIWAIMSQWLMIGGSLVLWILYFIEGSARRKAYGMKGGKWS